MKITSKQNETKLYKFILFAKFYTAIKMENLRLMTFYSNKVLLSILSNKKVSSLYLKNKKE